MHKSSLKALLTLAVAFVGAAAHAASPVLDPLPVVIISDAEGNITVDNNLFEFDATLFVFNDLVEDADTADDTLNWTFFYDTGDINNTGSLTINGDAPLATIGDALTETDVINRDGGSTPIANPFFVETSGSTTPIATSALGAPLDPDDDADNDTLVGELAVTFFVSDGTNVASDDTFVFTYDTTLADLSPVVDDLIFATGVPGFTFVNVPLTPIGTDTGADNWIFRDWDESLGGTSGQAGALFNLLDNGVSTGSVAGTALVQTGTGNGTLVNSVAAAFSQWINPGNATSNFTAGNTYGARAAVTINGEKTSSDNIRIGVQENTVSSLNITYGITARSGQTFSDVSAPGIANPFAPPVDGSTSKTYLSVADPIDADVASPVPFLYTNDFINNTAVALRTSSMVTFEVGSADTATYEANATANVQGPVNSWGGSGTAFTGGADGWEETSAGVGGPGLVGGGQFLRDVVSATVSASDIEIVTAEVTVNTTADIQWEEYSWFFDVNDIDGGSEATEDGSYSIAYSFSTLDGANTGRPSWRFRPDYPVPTFSIEFVVTPTRGNASTTDATVNSLTQYLVAPSQFTGSESVDLTGQENDLNLSFGGLPVSGNDGTITFSGAAVSILGLDDPNVDY